MEKRKKPKKEQKMSIKGIGKAENKANESRLIKKTVEVTKKSEKILFFRSMHYLCGNFRNFYM